MDQDRRRAPRGVELQTTDDPEVLALALVGEHDLATADDLEAALKAVLERATGVVVDTSRLRFLDVVALGVLERARDAARARGRRIVVQSGTGSAVRRLFAETGALERFQISETRDGAVTLAAPLRHERVRTSAAR